MTTLKQVAQRAGVSINTASRALNNKADVHRATRERVLKVAQELGYVPNALARSLVEGRSNTVGLVVADVTNPFSGQLTRGVEEAARAAGYALVLTNSNEDDALEQQAVRTLRSKRVDGLLIHPAQASYEHLEQCYQDGIPVVLLNRHIDQLNADYVINDNRSGAYQAVHHLVTLGHRRILHITGSERVSSVRERLIGYRCALDEAGIPFDPDLVINGELSMEGAYQAAHRRFGVGERPTAVFTYSDLLAIGVLKALHELGIDVPGDVSLVGYDDIAFAAFLVVPLTTVRQPIHQIGRRGFEILMRILNDPRWVRGQYQEVYQPELVVRASTAPPRTRAER